jgi:hypothetical protein
MSEPKYIEFHWAGYSKSGATETWNVMPKDNSGSLGIIKWFAAWRCYAFYPPLVETVFEKQCLRDIANFCEKVTKLQREKKLGIANNQTPLSTKKTEHEE